MSREVKEEVLRGVRVMLRWALLDDVEVVTRFGGSPRMLQVLRGGEVVFTASVKGREAALPDPRQPPLKGTEDVVAKGRFPAAAPSLAALDLFEVIAAGPLDETRRRFPGVHWRRLGGSQCGALVPGDSVGALREGGATVRPFDPCLDPPVIVEVWDPSDEARELAAQLAKEFGGVPSAPKQRHSDLIVESWVELPPTGSAEKLAFALSYLVENRVRFWVRPAATRRAGRAAKGGA